MEAFEILPNEVIEIIGSNLENRDLLLFSRANNRIKTSCSEIIRSRRQIFEEKEKKIMEQIDIWIKMLTNMRRNILVLELRVQHTIEFTHIDNNWLSMAEIMRKVHNYPSIFRGLFPGRIDITSECDTFNREARVNNDWEFLFINKVTQKELNFLLYHLAKNQMVQDAY